jgi:hypothetical protein
VGKKEDADPDSDDNEDDFISKKERRGSEKRSDVWKYAEKVCYRFNLQEYFLVVSLFSNL